MPDVKHQADDTLILDVRDQEIVTGMVFKTIINILFDNGYRQCYLKPHVRKVTDA